MTSNIANNIPITIFSVSDPEYLKCLRVLTASVNQNSPTTRLYYHLINCNDESVSKELLSIHPLIDFSFEKKQFQTNEQKRAYCANIRARLISNLLANGIDLLLYLDGDSIVRKDLSYLASLIKQHDILLMKRSDTKYEKMRFLTSSIGLNNTDATRKFVQRWANLLDEHIYEWWSDQLSFSKNYDELSSTINFMSLPQRFVDWRFDLFSPIWTGKGTRKHSAQLYLLEEQYYLKKLKGEQTLSLLLTMCTKRLSMLVTEIDLKSILRSSLGPAKRLVKRIMYKQVI